MLYDWLIDWFWLQKVELIPGVKIYSKEDISTMEGWTTNRESKNKNDLHGETSVEGFHWVEGNWSSVNLATEESLGRVAQVIFYPIPSLPYVIDIIKGLQCCPSSVVHFYVFYFQHSISSLRIHVGIEKSKLPLRSHCLPWFLLYLSSKHTCQ